MTSRPLAVYIAPQFCQKTSDLEPPLWAGPARTFRTLRGAKLLVQPVAEFAGTISCRKFFRSGTQREQTRPGVPDLVRSSRGVHNTSPPESQMFDRWSAVTVWPFTLLPRAHPRLQRRFQSESSATSYSKPPRPWCSPPCAVYSSPGRLHKRSLRVPR